MTTRLILLCAGATGGTRAGRFPDPCAPLDDGGRAKVRALARDWREGRDGADDGGARIAPSAAARETAALLGIAGAEEPALADQDAGAWRGRAIDAIGAAAVAGWLADPTRGAPGGEDMARVRARVGGWLDTLPAGRVVAVTHAAVIRAAIAHALGLPDAAALAIDIAPLTRVALSRHGRWRLQALAPAAWRVSG